MSDVEEKAAAIITGILGLKPDMITPLARFQNDLDADSLEVVDLIMSVEDAFDIEVPDDKAETLLTVGDIVAYIETQQQA